MLETDKSFKQEPIAVVGIGCRFPGDSNSPAEFWDILKHAKDCIVDVPSDRWDASVFYNADSHKAWRIRSPQGGFIKDVEYFDAGFFGYYAESAAQIDPQQRIALEVACEALEDAGESLDSVSAHQVSVFMSGFLYDHLCMQTASSQRDLINPYAAMGVSVCALANRISYCLNLKGPSISVDTACSGSLVALHLACQSIWNGESVGALAGGVNTILRPESSILLSQAGFLSPDARCKAFDSRANGYVRSEGCGIVYLKPLGMALEAKDDIYSIIHSTAVNQDGYTVAGFTVPDRESQIDMLKTAYRKAEIDPAQVMYVEAHGPGTSVGDPIETGALGEVIGRAKPETEKLIIGSVKTNIGHLEGASGIAGFIKANLVLKNRIVPPNLHFQAPNPAINFEYLQLRVSQENIPLKGINGEPPFAAVNSFGAGGTNAHTVLQAIETPTHTIDYQLPENDIIFVLSARSLAALKQLASRYLDYLHTSDESLESISLAQFTRRTRHEHQLYIIGRSRTDFEVALQSFMDDRESNQNFYTQQKKMQHPKLAFVFSGQGGQWPEMGIELMHHSQLFRRFMEEFDQVFMQASGWSVIEEIKKNSDNSQINETIIVQPAIAAIQISLVRLLNAYGVEADGVVGHSIGEIAAAYAAGAINLKQAAAIIYNRAKIQDQASGKGKMLAIGLSAQSVTELMAPYRDHISLATINGPAMVTLSGDAEPLERIASKLEVQGVFNRFVKVKVPYHSHYMEPLKTELIEVLGEYESQAPQRLHYSTVTTQQLTAGELTGKYWFRNVRQPVRFTETLTTMFADGFNTFIEIGPHPVLIRGIQDLAKQQQMDICVASIMNRRQPENIYCFFAAICGWLSVGKNILGAEAKSPAVKLPLYPWQHERYWYEGHHTRKARLMDQSYPFVVSRQKFVTNENFQFWEVGMGLGSSPYLADHTVEGTIIAPAATHMMLALASARDFRTHADLFLSDLSFDNALIVPDGKNKNLNVRIEISSDEGHYSICSRDAQAEAEISWSKHSTGKINWLRDDFASRAPKFAEVRNHFSEQDKINIEEFYEKIRDAGLNYGKTFQCIQELWSNGTEILARLTLHPDLQDEARRYLVHPSLYDAHLQPIFAVQHYPGHVYLPNSIAKVKVHRQATQECWAYVNCLKHDENWLCSDHWLFDEQANLVSELHGMAAKSIPNLQTQRDIAHENCYEYHWQPVTLVTLGRTEVTAEIVKGELLHCVIIAEADDALACDLEIRLKARRPEVDIIHGSLPEVLDGVLSGISLDRRTHLVYIPATSNCTNGDLAEDTQKFSAEYLLLVQYLIILQAIPNLFVVTRNASIVMQTDPTLNLQQAGLFGMARVFANEYPNLLVRVVDLAQTDLADSLCTELLQPREHHESEVAWRGDRRFVRQLQLVDTTVIAEQLSLSLPASGSNYQAYIPQSSVLGDIEFRQTFPSQPQANEIKIEVKAAALNYKDVLNATGLLSSKAVVGGLAANRIGLEVSGVISDLGADVDGFKIGDAVIARVRDGFAGTCTTPDTCVVRKPAHFSFAEAAAVPVVYLTAYYSLIELGRLQPGERVLIHSATGGVGLAAIQIAQSLDVQIIATAGNRNKRGYLHTQLGIEHVFDSRSSRFYDEVMEATEGQGVDLVLNSLSGSLITQGLKCLASYGRFIELGKTDIYNGSSLNLERLAENISYHVVDVDRLAAQKPKLHQQLMQEVLNWIEAYHLPPHPVTVFPIAELGQALKQMPRATHIGKIVLSMEDGLIQALPPKTVQFSAQRAYLISGGTSGFGLTLASWFVQKGVRKLVLASRSGCKTLADRQQIEMLQQAGVEVWIETLDVVDANAVQALVSRIKEHFGCIGGIIHAAGILDDSLIPNMTLEQFQRVWKPKAIGAWNFHLALETLNLNPDLFLMLSSISAVIGLKGQFNYATANYFEDALAEMRQYQGKTATSVNLGVLGDYAGMSRQDKDTTGTLELLETHGIGRMLKHEVLAKIEAALIETPVQRLMANLDWKKFGLAYPNLLRDSRFLNAFEESQQRQAGHRKHSGITLREEVSQLEESERLSFLSEKLTAGVSQLTGIPLELLNSEESIDRWALDSIMLGQISVWILRHTEINYPLIKLVKGPSLVEISAELLPQMLSSGSDTQSDTVQKVTDKDDGALLFELGAKELSPWLIRGSSSGNESKRLICFHSMGVGASLFTHFLLNPPSDTDILAVQLPGRENRSHEVCLQTVDEIVTILLEQLEPYLDKPYVIWGHSFGGITAFELIHRLREQRLPQPYHLKLTATIAPQLIKLWQSREVLKRVLVEENRAQYLISLARYTEDPEFVERILPIMRRDIPLLQNYQYRNPTRLDIPMTCWAAQQDDMVYPDEVAQWQQQTQTNFRLYEVQGDHWFLNSNKNKIETSLKKILVG